MMDSPRAIRRRVLPVLAGLVAILAALPAIARAEYGELGSPIEETGHVSDVFASTHVFAVNTADGSFYIGDEIESGGQLFYRIQKFNSGGGAPVAEARIEAPLEEASQVKPGGLEGLAIDTSLDRVYALVVERRGAEAAFDPEAPAAAELYAFSTVVNPAPRSNRRAGPKKPANSSAGSRPSNPNRKLPRPRCCSRTASPWHPERTTS